MAKKTIFLLFGATGDLAKRKLIPAFYKLYNDKKLDDNFILLGASGSKKTDEEFRKDSESNLKEFGKAKGKISQKFINRIHYNSLNFSEFEGYKYLFDRVNQMYDNEECELIIYLAIPPNFFETVLSHFNSCGINKSSNKNIKIVFEKPFGHDLESARSLNKTLMEVFEEKQVYRIDHYLGKDAVQNFLVMRFSNHLLEPLWNNRHIDNIQITAFEKLGVENRAKYYDGAGALRDMVQNHMFQMLSLIAMEPPVSLDADHIRDEKVKIFESLENFDSSKYSDVVFGQYDGYKNEEGIKENSRTETFVALKVEIKNWRWSGVPFYLRTGKKLNEKGTMVVVQFKNVPNILYNHDGNIHSNKLIIKIQPDASIQFAFNVKSHRKDKGVESVISEFDHKKFHGLNTAEAYELLINEIIKGDHTLFTRWDGVENSWKVIDELLMCKDNCPLVYNYKQGSLGPKEANDLIERDGRKWHNL